MGTFQTNYLSNYSALLAEAIKADSPYDKSIQFVKDEFENMNLTDSQKATLIAQYMANITNSITNNAMNIALSLTDKDGKYDDEVAMVANEKEISDSTKQNKISQSQVQSDIATATKQDKIDLVSAQLCKSNKECELVEEQKTQLTAGAIYNNYSKALDYFSEAYGQHKMGGGVITESMWSVPLDIAKALITNDTQYTFNYGDVTTSE